MLPDVLELVGVLVGSPIGTSDPTAAFIDVVLEQPIPYLECRQDAHLKTYVD